MKKVVSVLLVCVLILGSISYAMATEIMPRYNVITAVTSGIAPGNRAIEYDVYLHVPNQDTLDSAYIDIELRTTSGRVVASVLGRRMNLEGLAFMYSGSSPVTTNGTYFYTYEIRCYKNGVMVDNPTGTSRTLVYTP